ncbi:glucose-6-phosphate 1-dehydrogenase [Roridomyces roridus]|uniref:Glucose-6-phosphate 1-dehydrogenase n=1 Tax=Roridomyces roridus TaxID=1738132 RepID=A0AAD7C6H4_9AGAR|nr:glucose-6-phosphate 1-dehydrogenase [Roridomyces roridus]
MGWYRAVKEKLATAATKRDAKRKSLVPTSPTAPAGPTPHMGSSAVVSSSSDAAHYEMKGNTIIVVFGASGDLAKKKTFPALFRLFRQGFLPNDVKIVGYARTKMDKAEFHSRATSYIKKSDDDAGLAESIDKFKDTLTYVDGDYDTGAAFDVLNAHLLEIEAHYTSEDKNRLFYFALPPNVFVTVAKNIKEHVYASPGVNRIIVEKPFGKDLDSARELLSSLKQYWSEEETYRIDHYLGKEMVKNILVLRFANVAFASCWDKSHISNVQITFKEPFGTEGRGGYFDSFGIIRDVLQNHLLQVLSILTMERPVSFSAEDIRDEKVKVLRCIPPIAQEDTLLGQYVGADGKPGYLDDDTVPRGSVCPTFAATTLWINNPRWEGVPFILKAGKGIMNGRYFCPKSKYGIQFKDVTQGIFQDIARNELVIRIQPSEAVYLKMNAKTPGLQTHAMVTEMDLTYNRRFAEAKIPEAYEALILDALQGDHSNFVRHDELDVAWKIFTPILHWIDGKNGTPPHPSSYPYGLRGPQDLDKFIQKYGYHRTTANYEWPVTNLAKA